MTAQRRVSGSISTATSSSPVQPVWRSSRATCQTLVGCRVWRTVGSTASCSFNHSGHAKDPVHALRSARSMLTDEGFIVLAKTQSIRYARECAEKNDTSLGEEYF